MNDNLNYGVTKDSFNNKAKVWISYFDSKPNSAIFACTGGLSSVNKRDIYRFTYPGSSQLSGSFYYTYTATNSEEC